MWIRGPTIGRGSTATVSLATTTTGNLIAVKSTDHSGASFLQKEQHMLSQLSSPYIIEYIGFDITYENSRPMYNLFLEYVGSGSLSDLIKKQGGSINENLIKLYTHQILLGLDYLHSNNLVHCDIKSHNVLVGKNCAKIADLGCAKFIECGGGAATSAFSGTPVFMAPEVARGEMQGYPADVWALGCTIIEMATGSNPWPEAVDPVSVLYIIGYSGDLPEFPRWLSEEAKDLLSKCLKRDVEDRWTVKQLLEHPFFDDLECDFDQLKECTKKSPTSVLEQCIWESLPEPRRNPARTGSSSPAERIKGLVGSSFSVGPSLPNWGEEEDWITLRSNESEETEEISEQSGDVNSYEILASVESIGFSIVNVEEGESLIRNEDLLLECLDDHIAADYSIRTDPVSRFVHFLHKVINTNFTAFNSSFLQ